MDDLPEDIDNIKGPQELNLENPEYLKEAPPDSAEALNVIRNILLDVSPRVTDFFVHNRIDEAILLYLGCQCFKNYPLKLPENGTYDIEAIDV